MQQEELRKYADGYRMARGLTAALFFWTPGIDSMQSLHNHLFNLYKPVILRLGADKSMLVVLFQSQLDIP